jgi:hypothetical protein
VRSLFLKEEKGLRYENAFVSSISFKVLGKTTAVESHYVPQLLPSRPSFLLFMSTNVTG